jgi:twitching motility protein PilI
MNATPTPVASSNEQPGRPDAAERRSRLRQYQVQLLARMQAARTNTGARVNQLGVAMGDERYLLDLTTAGEIVSVAPVTAVPLTQAWYLGLANIRGSLVGVVDLARYLGLGETPVGAEARYVTFAPGLGMNCALLVSRVYGLRHAAEMTPEAARLRDGDGQAWTPLDLAALVRDERFLQVGL